VAFDDIDQTIEHLFVGEPGPEAAGVGPKTLVDTPHQVVAVGEELGERDPRHLEAEVLQGPVVLGTEGVEPPPQVAERQAGAVLDCGKSHAQADRIELCFVNAGENIVDRVRAALLRQLLGRRDQVLE
jgi:hypothetical protein